ncbi:hypothetical protein FSP39_019457 [Pinctada imbricata]|uniref:C3H1-type domain-containing protein n=1 Tax=Pinctada imbricata TaxID=66713 RepID=A0AA88XJS5_PINIB|nr:hypothetical protein FSP39_019457 [Pinctada imbricata]
MSDKQNIPSNAEDIDSPESDLEEEGEKYGDKKRVSLESAASPISESDNESIGKEKGEIERKDDMYNDVSDEEDSFSDDDDEGDNKIDSYKVDSAVKDVFKSDNRESKGKVLADSDARKSESRVRKDSVTSVPSHAGLGEDVELDYDEDGMDDDGKPQEDGKEKMDDSRGAENSDKDKKEDGEADSDKDDGELDDDEDCEEGEIREPGQRKPFVKPPCRFFIRGVCTWGSNCRFLHPGVNDKGNYRLIERPGGSNAPYGRGSGPWKGPDDPPSPKEEEEEEPEALPPPPPLPPQPETAWERGLRQAKEQLKKASQRKEMEPDFEQKRMNLSVEEEREFNKENDRQKVFKDPYYDQGYEDEYYDKPVHRSPSPIGWQPGQYENFEVRWTREPEWPPHPLQHYRERIPYQEKFHRKHFSPPAAQNYESAQRRHHHHHHRDTRRNNNTHWEGDRVPSQVQKEPVTRHKADTWHDPWRRSKSPKRKTRSSRSRSRGRRRSRRSHSYSSSFSSSSFSGSSRSRSSSYSSYSSRSSSRSSSSSRSPSKSKSPVKRPQGAARQKIAEPGKPGEKPRGTVAQKTDKQKPMMKRQQSRPDNAAQPQQTRAPPIQRPRGPAAGPPPNVPPEANKDKGKERPGAPQRPQRRRSSTRSRSRSSSSASSRSSRSSSLSSISSRSSSSSSGSADSEHLYRGVGGGSGREGAPISPKKKKGQKGVKPKDKMPEPNRGRPAGQQGKVPGQRQEARVTTTVQPTVKPKDPLKVTGQKPNIKLTLLANKPPSERQVPKKRPAGESDMGVAPPSKKANVSTAQPSKPDKKLKKPDKPAQAKPTPAPSSKATSNQPVTSPTKVVKAPPLGGAPPVAMPTKEKKSTSSRREELLKQLKAVEDAIARKRSKMS